MRTERRTWTTRTGWTQDPEGGAAVDADWVIYFAAPEALDAACYAELRRRYPRALLQGCTTGGEIACDDVADGSVTALAVRFEGTRVRGAQCAIVDPSASFAVGATLARELGRADLRAVFVLSDGTGVNGTELVRGLRSELNPRVAIAGGLAGDGPRFVTTRAGLDAAPASGTVCAVGLYGDALTVGQGSAGGWVPFGPERLVTRAVGNVLHALDHQPALDLYTRYLGEEAAQLPASALLYPLLIRRRESRAEAVVRTIVGIDADAKTMTFAGDIPEGAIAQLMRASVDQLVDGAALAASAAKVQTGRGFAIMVSCIGRKLLMGQRTCDEVDAAVHALGADFPAIGFYSYGEIAPCATGFADLHNQTMTVTTFAEQ